MRGTVFVFAKAPRAGVVKTRLGAEIGMGRAAALFRIMAARVVAEAARGSWRTVVAIDPVAAMKGWENIFPPDLARMPQGGGDLGERMARAITAAPSGPVIIIGADAPGLRTHHLREAFSSLRGADAVFGPASDGGYWLIGLSRRRPAPDLFNDVRWSTKHALGDTRKSLPPGFQLAELGMLSDVDAGGDLVHLGLRSTQG